MLDWDLKLLLGVQAHKQRKHAFYVFGWCHGVSVCVCGCVQGLPEAEPSGEVFKYSCQARSRLESTLELRLEGLGKLTGNETFTYDLVVPATKQSALRNALQLVPLFGSMTDPSQPLRLFAWPFALMEVVCVVCAQLLLPCTPCCQYSNLQ